VTSKILHYVNAHPIASCMVYRNSHNMGGETAKLQIH